MLVLVVVDVIVFVVALEMGKAVFSLVNAGTTEHAEGKDEERDLRISVRISRPRFCCFLKLVLQCFKRLFNLE